jgi:hypothetical protein
MSMKKLVADGNTLATISISPAWLNDARGVFLSKQPVPCIAVETCAAKGTLPNAAAAILKDITAAIAKASMF